MQSYKEVVRDLSIHLKNITHIPLKEVEILLLHIIKQNTIWLYMNYNDKCECKKELEKLVLKRAENYPLEYITLKASFYGETFLLDKQVLIPRPQTEILVEKAEVLLKTIKNPKVVEVGTGSGVISVMLALLLDDIEIIAVDINEFALQIALKNAIKFNVQDKITFIKSDIFEKIDVINFDMCISNPPYIKNSYKLAKNVKYEPHNALFGGNNGDELLKKILEQSHENKIKYLFCEMGYDQKSSMSEYFKNYNINNLEFYNDYENFNRGFTLNFKYDDVGSK